MRYMTYLRRVPYRGSSAFYLRYIEADGFGF